MKERGILMSRPMVRQTRAGLKTVTRRLLDPQPTIPSHYLQKMWGRSPAPNPVDFGTPFVWCEVGPDYPDGDDDLRYCPHGVPGDRLWVREAWRLPPTYDKYSGNNAAHIAGAVGREVSYIADEDGPPFGRTFGRYRHARFMPRWASRILLEITNVDLQRLQAMTVDDARCEGIPEYPSEAHRAGFDMSNDNEGGDVWRNRSSVENFAALFDLLNGEGMFRKNPYVWVIDFKPVTP